MMMHMQNKGGQLLALCGATVTFSELAVKDCQCNCWDKVDCEACILLNFQQEAKDEYDSHLQL